MSNSTSSNNKEKNDFNNDPITYLEKNLKKFLRKTSEPKIFRILDEVNKALNDSVFYAKYVRIPEKIYAFELNELLKIVQVDEKLRHYINIDTQYKVSDNGICATISLENRKRVAIISPRGIFGVNAEHAKVDRIIEKENDMFKYIVKESGFYDIDVENNFDFGEIYVLTTSFANKNVNDIINAIAKGNYSWKKGRMKIKSNIVRNIVPKGFPNKKYIIDHIDVLYKGDDITKNESRKTIIIIPPEKITTHVGKVLKFYFDENLDTNQIKILHNSIDISDIQLPNLKTRKMKFEEKVEQIRRPYIELNMVKNVPIEFIRGHDKIINFSENLLKMITKEIDKDANINDVWINNYSSNVKILSTNKTIIYQLPDRTIIKINKDILSPKDPGIFISEKNYTTIESYELISSAIFKKFKIKKQDMAGLYISFIDGIIIGVNKKVGDGIIWDTYDIELSFPDNNSMGISVNVRGNIIWVRPKETGKIYRRMIERDFKKIIH